MPLRAVAAAAAPTFRGSIHKLKQTLQVLATGNKPILPINSARVAQNTQNAPRHPPHAYIYTKHIPHIPQFVTLHLKQSSLHGAQAVPCTRSQLSPFDHSNESNQRLQASSISAAISNVNLHSECHPTLQQQTVPLCSSSMTVRQTSKIV